MMKKQSVFGQNHLFDISEVLDSEEKSKIVVRILKSLRKWFGIDSAVSRYADEVREFPFFVVRIDGEAVGFLALKQHNSDTAEIFVMGVSEAFHRMGIGNALVARAEEFCCEKGIKFLTVKTLDGSAKSEAYEKTRKFYEKVGFYHLEVFPELWDKQNPCLFLLKSL